MVFNEIFEVKKNNFDDDLNFDTLNSNESLSPFNNLDTSSSEPSLPKEWKYIDAHHKELIT